MLIKDQEGGPRGKPYQGVSPSFFALLRVRLYVCRLTLRPTAFSTPFLLSCQKKRRRAVKEKRSGAVFTIAGRTRRWQCLSVVSANRDAPFAPGEGEVGSHLAVDAPGSLRRGRTCHLNGQGNCLRQVQHNVRPAIKKIRTKGRFSLGLTPFLLARAKEMGCLAVGPYHTAHTERRTRRNVKKKGEPPARVPPYTPSCASLSTRGFRALRSAARGSAPGPCHL